MQNTNTILLNSLLTMHDHPYIRTKFLFFFINLLFAHHHFLSFVQNLQV